MVTSHFSSLLPDWPVPPNVRSVCSTRAGGVSTGPFESLNLGDHVGDGPAAVAVNRERFAAAIEARPVFMRQVHGQRVAVLDASSSDGIEADACVTRVAGVACTIMVADCLPVLLAADDGRTVGAAHAGWRGLAGHDAGGVIEAVIEAMTNTSGVDASKLLVWLGPCIGPDKFEVGADVKSAFEHHDPAARMHFRSADEGKWMADLPGLARQRLAAAGVTRIFGNDGTRDWCTVSNPSRFFSHRRDRISGRFAAAISIST
jgi:YfiH family protein